MTTISSRQEFARHADELYCKVLQKSKRRLSKGKSYQYSYISYFAGQYPSMIKVIRRRMELKMHDRIIVSFCHTELEDHLTFCGVPKLPSIARSKRVNGRGKRDV